MQVTDFVGSPIELGDTVAWSGKRGLVKGTVREIRLSQRNGRWNSVLNKWEPGNFTKAVIYVKADDRRYNGGYRRPVTPSRVVKVVS